MYNYGVKLKEIKETFSAEVFKEKEFRLIRELPHPNRGWGFVESI
ncbi:MAG: hypothetical protein ACRCX2_17055 [Paraclostridium sp.]